MANLSEFTSYKNKILEELTKDNKLMRALGNDYYNALDRETPSKEDIIYQRMFPYKRSLDKIIIDTRSVISMEFAAQGMDGGHFKDIGITFYVLVHEDNILMMDQGQTKLRNDYIAERIDVIINQARGYGIGKMNFDSLRPVNTGSPDFIGVAIIYSTVDFN